ncbi:MAG: ATP-binding protein [Acidimicrobiia bacterium]|nr:ATP-binding protein [Acidimicrobiia bacterium]
MADFFLGGILDPETGERSDDALHYEGSHLTTHGVILGMTGSGKTGLGVIVLEEALRSGVPVLVIDPKGDMGNLALTFPDFAPDDFAPWVDASAGAAEDKGVDELAAGAASLWEKGLAGWGLGGDDVRALRDGSQVTVYTPGSTAGTPLNVIGSLAPPDLSWDDAEIIRDEIEGFVSSLLVLADIDADPVTSPEHILLSTIIEHHSQAGTALDLATLIGEVLDPPVRTLGVFELDAFFPPDDRRDLAMRLNGLVASPSFASWLEGPALDVETLLFDEDKRPNAAVISIAHLSDAERQFVVTLLLGKVVTWMRSLEGTGELRALIYMDEVFGFAPPTAEPPSKKPILTILKQARAYGVGLVLSTQNPVDLDYKAMSNAGTWMIGRLQTERDKARIMEGLRSASGDVDVAMLDRAISGLGKREFILHSTRRSSPTRFTTRWAMSYLAGPLSREQLGLLKRDVPTSSPNTRTVAEAAEPPITELRDGVSPVMPDIHASLRPGWLSPSAPWATTIGADHSSTTYGAGVAARVRMRFDDRYAEVDHTEEWEVVWPQVADSLDPDDALPVDHDDRDLTDDPPDRITYDVPEADLSGASWGRDAAAALKAWLVANERIELLKHPDLKLYSRVGEGREQFLARCTEAAERSADEAIEKIRGRFASRISTVQGQLRNAELRVRELEADIQVRQQNEVLSGAGDLLGSILGGRRRSSSIRGIASRRAQTQKAQLRLQTAEAKQADTYQKLIDLEDDLQDAILEETREWTDLADDIEPILIGLEKDDVDVVSLRVVWIPGA